jgi:hypothetical protein
LTDLERLEEAKRRRPGAGEVARLLRSLRERRFTDAGALIRFHDTLLFLRAYPHSRTVMKLAEDILSSFASRVAILAASGADLSPFDDPEVSGIVGTSVTTDYSYDVVLWLKKRFGRHVAIDWEGYEGADRLRTALPPWLPLLEEEAIEDANVPYRDYLRQARARGEDDLSWLLSRIAAMRLPPAERAERYDALGLAVAWSLGGSRATRTRMRSPARRIFFHDVPLITRRDVSLEAEISSEPLAIRRLPRREALAVLETTREATALRYREYYAFTFGDPSAVLQAEAGRGLQILLIGTQRGRRLPLRSGYGGFLVKNGVPIGYFEALAFFERMELGFNLYYAFREGESAWIFARSVKFLRQALGVTSFSLDPYQIGYENEEAIASGAFWFYRKLGFHSTDPKLRELTAREEKKLAADPSYRTPASVLRRLATQNLLYEVGVPSHPEEQLPSHPEDQAPCRSEEQAPCHPEEQAPCHPEERSDEGSAPVHNSRPTTHNPQTSWDCFHVRNIALAVARRMAREFGGDAEKIRRASESGVARALGVNSRRWSREEQEAFAEFALVLGLVPDLPRWKREEKQALVEVVRAKVGPRESRFLHLLQRHARLRAAVIRLGSSAHGGDPAVPPRPSA